MNYDFSQLNDKDFEVLSTDLLSLEVGKQIERFKPGKDAGVDGRFFSNDGFEIVIQCKHYLKSGYNALIAAAKKEALKLHKLNPERYIFVTSLPLSRQNKIEIKRIFSPYIKKGNDIFGQEDLNDLLAKYPRVEERHFKLWIASTNVLFRMINNAIKGRSEYEIERIKKNTNRYVVTGNHNKAVKILDENNVLIISGEPGIGKTTLAENICLFFVANDYMFFDIEENLNDAEQVYIKGEKQIFYFDDFLGSNYFEAIENKKDSHIVKFIDRVKQDKSKKFILTSRTNILNNAIIHSSIFDNKKIQKNEFLLVIQSLKNIEKAHILYNHIWFSKLDVDFIEEIYKDKRYHNIIRHKNFNPRLIEFITDTDRIGISANRYWEFIVKTLDNPKDIWNNNFKIQSNIFVRNLVMLTVFNGGEISEDDLKLSFNELNVIENIKNTSHTEKDFSLTAQMAVRSFLNRESIFSRQSYSLFNPSITDFVLSEYCQNIPKLIAVYKSLFTLESLKTIIALEKENIISSKDFLKILDELFIYGFDKDKKIDYLIVISHLLADNINKKDQILELLNKIISTPISLNEFSKFIHLIKKFKDDLNIEDFSFLSVMLKNVSLKKLELISLIDLLGHYWIDDQDILDTIAEQVENHLSSELNQIIADSIDISDHIHTNTIRWDEYDFEEKIVLDSGTFLSETRSYLKQRVEEIMEGNSYIGNKLDIDYSSVLDSVDEDEITQEYINSLEAEHQADMLQDYDYDKTSGDNDIDDLFERS